MLLGASFYCHFSCQNEGERARSERFDVVLSRPIASNYRRPLRGDLISSSFLPFFRRVLRDRHEPPSMWGKSKGKGKQQSAGAGDGPKGHELPRVRSFC